MLLDNMIAYRAIALKDNVSAVNAIAAEAAKERKRGGKSK